MLEAKIPDSNNPRYWDGVVFVPFVLAMAAVLVGRSTDPGMANKTQACRLVLRKKRAARSKEFLPFLGAAASESNFPDLSCTETVLPMD